MTPQEIKSTSDLIRKLSDIKIGLTDMASGKLNKQQEDERSKAWREIDYIQNKLLLISVENMFKKNAMTSNENDEIEINGVKYVRKEKKNTTDTLTKVYQCAYLCGAPDCDSNAAISDYIRNTEIVHDDIDHDTIYFTCERGHRNQLHI